MRRNAVVLSAALLAIMGFLLALHAQPGKSVAITTVNNLDLRSVTAEAVKYKDRPAIRVTDAAPEAGDAERMAIVRGTSFTDGTIEVDLVGDTPPGAPEGARGFVGPTVCKRRVAAGAHRE